MQSTDRHGDTTPQDAISQRDYRFLAILFAIGLDVCAVAQYFGG